VAHYDHDEGKAISGGFVYQGRQFPLLKGKYIFGDITNGRVFFVESGNITNGKQTPIQEFQLTLQNKPFTFSAYHQKVMTDLRFGLGLNGEMLLFTKADGRIYQITGVH